MHKDDPLWPSARRAREGWSAWRMRAPRERAGGWQLPMQENALTVRREEYCAAFYCRDLPVVRLARTLVGRCATSRRRDIHDPGCRSGLPVARAEQTSRRAREFPERARRALRARGDLSLRNRLRYR